MAVWMQPIKVNCPKLAHEPHGVKATEGTRCHMCEHLCCIPQRGKLAPWRFYCGRKGRCVNPREVSKVDCPIGREMKRGRKKTAGQEGKER